MSRDRTITAALLMRQLIIIVFLAASATGLYAQKQGYYDPREIARARVVKIEKNNIDGPVNAVEIRVHLRAVDGKHRGRDFVSVYRGEDDMPGGMFYSEGDVVFIGISTIPGADSVEYISIYDVDNTKGIVIMGVLFALTVLLVGRFRGLLSMLSLIATMILVFVVLIPGTLEGRSPLPLTVMISLAAVCISIPVMLGFKKKTAASITGASAGVIIAVLISLFAGWLMHLSGIVTGEMMTVFYASGIDIDLRGLALSGMVLSALGAIMDVCISIASAADEIFKTDPEISAGQAFKSVFSVSSDMLGATVNTLLFSYLGGALPVVLLIWMKFEPGMPVWLALNYNPVLSELVKSAVGCMGMFLSMPITALVSIELHRRSRRKMLSGEKL